MLPVVPEVPEAVSSPEEPKLRERSRSHGPQCFTIFTPRLEAAGPTAAHSSALQAQMPGTCPTTPSALAAELELSANAMAAALAAEGQAGEAVDECAKQIGVTAKVMPPGEVCGCAGVLIEALQTAGLWRPRLAAQALRALARLCRRGTGEWSQLLTQAGFAHLLVRLAQEHRGCAPVQGMVCKFLRVVLQCGGPAAEPFRRQPLLRVALLAAERHATCVEAWALACDALELLVLGPVPTGENSGAPPSALAAEAVRAAATGLRWHKRVPQACLAGLRLLDVAAARCVPGDPAAIGASECALGVLRAHPHHPRIQALASSVLRRTRNMAATCGGA